MAKWQIQDIQAALKTTVNKWQTMQQTILSFPMLVYTCPPQQCLPLLKKNNHHQMKNHLTCQV